jgi:hypothetical protein
MKSLSFDKILRYIAVILGFQASAFFLFFLISEGAADLIEAKFRILPLFLMMIYTVAGFVMAIIKAVRGGLIMVSGGLIMCVYLLFMGGASEYQMALIYGLPFIIPGSVFYYLGRKKASTPSSQNIYSEPVA